MSTSVVVNHRKRHRHIKAPKPLGVLEFTSALNGDDPIQILQKLHQFVRVVGYQRRLVTTVGHDADDAAGSREGNNDEAAVVQDGADDNNSESEDDTGEFSIAKNHSCTFFIDSCIFSFI